MAPRNNRKRKNGNGKGNRNGNRRKGTTTRMSKNLGSNGLSAKGALRRPMINRPFIEAGTDFLGPLTVLPAPATAADRILLSNSISPTAFPGTRLTQLSNLWERYRFRKFRLRWVPAVPKTIACQLIVYQDTDPLDDPSIITDADALIRQATAQAGSQQFNFINPMAIELSKRADDQLYYTGPDKNNERFSRQGNFYVIQVTDPLNFNGEPLPSAIMAGSLYVDWICEFQVAQINPSAVIQAIRADSQLFPATGVFPVLLDGETIPAGLETIGDITITASSYLSLNTFETDFTSTGSIIINVDGSRIGRIRVESTDILVASTPVLYSPGTYAVTANAASNYTLLDDFTFNYFNLDGSVPSFLPSLNRKLKALKI